MATTIPAIEVSGLHKNFGRNAALSGMDLRVESGQVAGFLGPNGAGKSTTIRILLGLLRADGGRARMLGAAPWADAVALHRRVAYVPGEVNLWPNLTGCRAISIQSKLHGQVDEQRRSQLLERFDLDPSKKARSYSKGNRQKVAPGRGALLPRRTAAGRADLRIGPIDGAGLHLLHPRGR